MTTGESIQDITLTGRSGEIYYGKIYPAGTGVPTLQGKAIACLSNSVQTENGWTHQVNAVYNTDDMGEELKKVGSRDDISHLILIPLENIHSGVPDKVDDLIRNYIHR